MGGFPKHLVLIGRNAHEKFFPESDCKETLGLACSLFHFLSKAERPHVGPNFLDIGQTFQGIEGDWEYLRSL